MRDLCDVLFDLGRRHTKTGIDELQSLLLWVDDDLNLLLISVRIFILPIISLASFVIASQPLEITSRAKMSWSEYSHFLIIGKIFSLLIERLPVRLLIMNNSFLFFSKKVKRIFAFRLLYGLETQVQICCLCKSDAMIILIEQKVKKKLALNKNEC